MKLTLAQLHQQLGGAAHLAAAHQLYDQLLRLNPEDTQFYAGFEATLSPPPANEEARVQLYQELQKRFPFAHAPRHAPLHFTTGQTFERLLAAYLQRNLRKGMIPCFELLRSAYAGDSQGRPAIIERVISDYVHNLEASAKFTADATEEELPSTLIWAYYFAAQHFNEVAKFQQAMTYADKALSHTPTLIELYAIKARILKNCGNLPEAAHWLNFARDLDTADRFINSISVKCMLRAGQIEEGEKTASFFTKVWNG